MKKNICLLFVLLLGQLLGSHDSAAQTVVDNTVVRDALDYMFEDLDKSKVPTGLLLDYAVDLVDFPKYNGTELNDSNYVNESVYEEIMLSLHSASVSTSMIPPPSIAIPSFKNSGTPNWVNLSFIVSKYNYIKASALDDNLINYEDGKVSDVYVDGVWQNPYEEDYILGFIPSSSICRVGTVNFKIHPIYTFEYASNSFLKFDAGDGLGYRTITVNSPISVNYATEGMKELKFLYQTTDGRTLESHSSIYVEPAPIGVLDGTVKPVTQIDTVFRTSMTHTGKTVEARVTAFFRSGQSRITKPFIVAEGFDPWEVMNPGKTDADSKLGDTNYIKFHGRWEESALMNKFDLIYIDWHDSIEDIRDNACLLEDIIKYIDAKKDKSLGEPSTLMGQSMGGLIARVALCNMEGKGEPHGISYYISHDSPHLGANVPLGALYFAHDAFAMINGYQTTINVLDILPSLSANDMKRAAWEALHSPAARQMLVNHLSGSGVIDNTFHDSWQEELERIGFPQGDLNNPIECLAIVNGTPNDQSDIFQVLGGQHYLYLDGYIKSTFLADILYNMLSGLEEFDAFLSIHTGQYMKYTLNFIGSNRIDIHAEINPFLGYNNKISDITITYTKKFLWLFPKTYPFFSSQRRSPQSGLLYDSFAGSGFMPETDDFNIEEPIMNHIKVDTMTLYKSDIYLGLTDRFMFIPSASALNMHETTISNYMRDYYVDPPLPRTECPFDAYCLTDTLQDHIHLNDNIYDWLDNQLNLYLDGPDRPATGDCYSLRGNPGNMTWSTSDSSIATIDNSGYVTVTGEGLVSIIAESFSNGKLIRKKKDVMIGFPNMVIQKSYEIGQGYVFRAEGTSAAVTNYMNQLIEEGEYQFEWIIINDDSEMTVQMTSENVLSYIPEKDEVVTVSVRVVDSEGRKGQLYSINNVSIYDTFTANYRYVVVTSDNEVYFIKSDGTYVNGIPEEDFSVAYTGQVYQEDDNINIMHEKYMKGLDCYLAYPNNMNSLAYIKGATSYGFRWTFPLFDRDVFLGPLSAALESQGVPSGQTMYELDLTICNSLKEKLQRYPFAIIYKEDFPEN